MTRTMTPEEVAAWPRGVRRAANGMPIGHGRLADYAAEPMQVAGVGRIFDDDWQDTFPSGPMPLDDASAACVGCSERARPCPRPRACWLEEPRDSYQLWIVLVWAIGLTAAAAVVVLF